MNNTMKSKYTEKTGPDDADGKQKKPSFEFVLDDSSLAMPFVASKCPISIMAHNLAYTQV
jgi:hypothetical protein